MRTKKQILKDYALLINDEKGMGFSVEDIEKNLEDPQMRYKLEKDIKNELLKSESLPSGQLVSSTRAFYIWCKVILKEDLKTGDQIWNGFVRMQFEMIEQNKQCCYMAPRGHGKSFFLALYILFKMFLLDYFDVCYCSNVPVQRKRFLTLCESLVDTNEILLEKKDATGVLRKDVPWGQVEMVYNKGTLEGTTVGTTPRGGHYNLAVGDDPLRDDRKYTYEFIANYFQGVLKPTIYRKKGRYIVVGCVTPNTKIITEEGIEEIGDQLKYDPHKKDLIPFKKKVYGKDGWDQTSKFYVNGKTQTKKIILENGYELKCSKIHPLWTCKSPRRGVKDIIKKDCGWVKSSDLLLGDKVAIKIGTQVFGKTQTISEDDAYFYGLFIAEGCVYIKGRSNRITISNNDEYCVSFLKEKLNFISQDEVHHRKNNKVLVKRMKDYGISFERSYNKRVPKKIMKEPKHVQVAFLQGLYDSDGHSTISNNKGRVVLTSTSKKQLLDVQVMLLNFGILTSLNKSFHKGHHKLDGSYIKGSKSYSLTCSGINAINFMKEIGFRIKRKNKCMDKINHTKNGGSFGFIWKKIKKIEDSESYTVDFVIPKNHSFITNGIVSHNTPQDPEDLFHTLMNDKLDKNQRPIGSVIKNGGTSYSGFYSKIFPAILSHKTKKVLVPEIWTYDELMNEKSRIGEIRFNREMMCTCITHRNSLISSSLFKSRCDESLQFIQQAQEGKKYMIVVDSATSDAPTADYCAITVFEDDPDKNKFIPRNLFHGKGVPITDPSGGTDDQTHEVYRRWKDFNKPLVVIERNNAGIALIQSLRGLAARNGEDIDIIEHYTHVSPTGRPSQKAGKSEDVVEYIEKGLKGGIVSFPCDPQDIYTIDAFEKIKTEHLNFGVKRKKTGESYEALAGHDDILDTFWIGFKFRGDKVDTLPAAITMDGGIY